MYGAAPLETLPRSWYARPSHLGSNFTARYTLSRNSPWALRPSALPQHGYARRHSGTVLISPRLEHTCVRLRAAPTPRIATAYSRVARHPDTAVCDQYRLLPAYPWRSQRAGDATDTNRDGPAQQP